MTTQQLALHLRQLATGGNWTSVDLQSLLSDLTLAEATQRIGHANTILALAYHIGYYVEGVLPIFETNALEIHDQYSFNHPTLQSEEDWKVFVNRLIESFEILASRIDGFDDDALSFDFAAAKYGSYFRNFLGLIEHSHYHLGQIALLKKMIRQA